MGNIRLQHLKLKRRIRKNFYYPPSAPSCLDNLSFPLNEFVVNYFDKNAPFDNLELSFASHLSREACVSSYTLIMAMVYLERLRCSHPDYFDTSDPSDLYTTALILANKYLYDNGSSDYAFNDEWANSAGKPLQCVNRMELEMLDKLCWKICVKQHEFRNMLNAIEIKLALQQSSSRTWLTYSEIEVLSSALVRSLEEILTIFLSTLTVMSVTYCATILGLCSHNLTTSVSSLGPKNSSICVTETVAPIDLAPPLPVFHFDEIPQVLQESVQEAPMIPTERIPNTFYSRHDMFGISDGRIPFLKS